MTGSRRPSQVPKRDNRRASKARLSNRPTSPKTQMEQEKRIRREIANSNERRRMQSINAGFQSLRTLLPHHDGEKLSKLPDRCREHLALPPGGIGPPPPFLLSWPFLRSLAHPRTRLPACFALRVTGRRRGNSCYLLCEDELGASVSS
ncbi:hypothetical protein HPB49_000964 [Dermacentor silvarum]|uniref:Uncharacterized protein n=1 Tax=Dermacentor silvarum TaxID=543639 RepID=A0ACB8CUB2_DERSI|nr:hypothetical protein HPB49_000964 [Dermacentor silvarum]